MRIILSTQTGIHYKLGIISALNFPTNIHKPVILCMPTDGDNHKHNGEGSHVVEKGHFLINVSNHTVYFKVIYHHRFLSFQRICSWRTVAESSSFCNPGLSSTFARNDKPRQHVKKQRQYFANKGPCCQSYGFSSSYVRMWKLDHKEVSVQKNWCFQTVVLEKTLESPSDSKEIKPVNPKGNHPWIFIGGTDAEAEAPILWPPDVKSRLIRKDPDAGKDWRQEEKGTTEDEMVGWHHRLHRHEFEQTLGVGEGQGSLKGSPWRSQRVRDSWVTEQQKA